MKTELQAINELIGEWDKNQLLVVRVEKPQFELLASHYAERSTATLYCSLVDPPTKSITANHLNIGRPTLENLRYTLIHKVPRRPHPELIIIDSLDAILEYSDPAFQKPIIYLMQELRTILRNFNARTLIRLSPNSVLYDLIPFICRMIHFPTSQSI